MIKNNQKHDQLIGSPASTYNEIPLPELNRRIIVAPMMGYTDRHARMLFRMISPNSFLFTEMVVASALIHGDADRFLRHAADEPCALQLGGSDPTELATCAKIGEAAGYQEINLNVGCPSDRVQQGAIGACLMAEPNLVGQCIAAMQAAVDIPVTVKCRIGIDDQDSYESFSNFIQTVSEFGCTVFYVHARKAYLQGLSPRENREIPPLKYDYVHRIQKDFPDLSFFLNGGIDSKQAALEHLNSFSGVMMGRTPYKDPYLLAELESELYGTPLPHRLEIVDQFVNYARTQPDSPRHLIKHLLGLYAGCQGARQFRRAISEGLNTRDAGLDLVYSAIETSGIEAERERYA